jgi:hypothetical protein
VHSSKLLSTAAALLTPWGLAAADAEVFVKNPLGAVEEFGTGLLSGLNDLKDLGVLLYKLQPDYLLIDPQEALGTWLNVARGLMQLGKLSPEYATLDPLGAVLEAKRLADSTLDLKDLESGHLLRWQGHMTPAALLALFTAGTGAPAEAGAMGAAGEVASEEAGQVTAAAVAERSAVDAGVAETPASPEVAQSGDAVSAESWRLTGSDDRLAKAAERVTPAAGFHDVVVHGTSTGFSVLRQGKWIGLDHRSLAASIRSVGYERGPIRLISCHTGALDAGAAQNLANKLGVTVMAPTDTVWILPNGSLSIGRRPFVNTGSWRLFKPGAKP